MTELQRCSCQALGVKLATIDEPSKSLGVDLNIGQKPSGFVRRYVAAIPFFLMHLAPLGVIWTGSHWQDWAVCFGLYWVRMFGVTGAYHRYFAHRSYKTSRGFQLLLAFLAQTSSQKGALWWAAHHRVHHKYSDTDKDPHDSRRGFWFSHLGWLFDDTERTDYERIRDLAKYPELVWLNKYWVVPPALLGFGVWWLLGWSGLWIGFALSTVLLWHGTFTINSLSHIFGSQRYDAGDESRNNWLLALITMGEGWHNNHHHYMTSARQGFYWWEIDVTYYVLKLLNAVGLIWEVRVPTERALADVALKRDAAQLASESQQIAPAKAA